MPRYDVVCPIDGEREIVARMSEARWEMPCDLCGTLSPQIPRAGAHTFVQDNLRLFRGADGTRFSHALGADMPESRRERDRLARAKGVEFTTRAELLADSKEAAEAIEYRAHVDSGGERKPHTPAVANWKVEKPKVVA